MKFKYKQSSNTNRKIDTINSDQAANHGRRNLFPKFMGNSVVLPFHVLNAPASKVLKKKDYKFIP